MGNVVPHAILHGRKRKFDDVEQQEADAEEDNLNTPKKKKLKSTSKYIFETLFVNGEGSDIKLVALGKVWPLHKVYLCQSGYFASMFSGSWKESDLDVIHMNFPDENITESALRVALGSLYQDDVLLEPVGAVSVLAAATLLSLDGLIVQCADVLQETISAKTVCKYHSAAVTYGQQQLALECIDWLEKNLMTSQTVELLRDISCQLMVKLVLSDNLFVIQVEMDLYSMLKKWLFLQLHPIWQGKLRDLTRETEPFFRSRAGLTCEDFLSTVRGAPYAIMFRGLRIQHLVNDLASVKILEQDHIIPMEWLMSGYRRQWLQMLQVEQGQDQGPNEEPETTAFKFPDESLRCGRVLYKEGDYCWRWTGYNFGVDLLLSFTNRLFTLRRNTHQQTTPGAACLKNERHVMFKLTVASFDNLGHAKYIKTSGLKHLSLGKDEDAIIMTIERHVAFPLRVSCNFLVYTPKEEWAEQKTAENVSQSKSTTCGASNHQNINTESGAEIGTNSVPALANPDSPEVSNE
ncbi:Germ cell-less protein-like 1 [Lamellibrachia satsuma]|nr:Germ cell-less protein-like 1 [Lamellibrachia satsuma]